MKPFLCCVMAMVLVMIAGGTAEAKNYRYSEPAATDLELEVGLVDIAESELMLCSIGCRDGACSLLPRLPLFERTVIRHRQWRGRHLLHGVFCRHC